MKVWETVKGLYQLKKMLPKSESEEMSLFKTILRFTELAMVIGVLVLFQNMLAAAQPDFQAVYGSLTPDQKITIFNTFSAFHMFGAALFSYLIVLAARLLRVVTQAYAAYQAVKEMQAWMQSTATFSASEQD